MPLNKIHFLSLHSHKLYRFFLFFFAPFTDAVDAETAFTLLLSFGISSPIFSITFFSNKRF